eukprot:Platyproteum_vivax@DN452_c0_g1_i1.p1
MPNPRRICKMLELMKIEIENLREQEQAAQVQLTAALEREKASGEAVKREQQVVRQQLSHIGQLEHQLDTDNQTTSSKDPPSLIEAEQASQMLEQKASAVVNRLEQAMLSALQLQAIQTRSADDMAKYLQSFEQNLTTLRNEGASMSDVSLSETLKILSSAHSTLAAINRQTSELLEISHQVADNAQAIREDVTKTNSSSRTPYTPHTANTQVPTTPEGLNTTGTTPHTPTSAPPFTPHTPPPPSQTSFQGTYFGYGPPQTYTVQTNPDPVPSTPYLGPPPSTPLPAHMIQHHLAAVQSQLNETNHRLYSNQMEANQLGRPPLVVQPAPQQGPPRIEQVHTALSGLTNKFYNVTNGVIPESTAFCECGVDGRLQNIQAAVQIANEKWSQIKMGQMNVLDKAFRPL